MAHYINLVIQTLLRLLLVVRIENFVQCLYFYFTHSPKRHLEFIKITKLMATKGNKIFRNVKTRWISMLSPAKRVMVEYKTILVKMTLDNPTNQQGMLNYEHLCDIHIFLGLACILPLLESMHALIKFAQSKDVFVCYLVVPIKDCQGDVYNIYCDLISKFTIDSFWVFKSLLELKHENMHMRWIVDAKFGIPHLAFELNG